MDRIPHLTREDLPAYPSPLWAMYSSIFGGIVTDPGLMMIPLDDHVVHRADGVFETIKAVAGALYNVPGHLARLRESASFLHLGPPPPDPVLTGILRQTVAAAARPDALVRVLFTRGPGGMGISPYDCPAPALYVAAYELPRSFMERHPAGAAALPSAIPVKPGGFARAKICNYLPNMLMKKEAVDRGVHFVFSFDDDGHLAESATENVGIVDREGWLRVPTAHHILQGTTMNRALHFAGALAESGLLAGVARTPIARNDLTVAREVLIFGTTTDVTAVVAFDHRPVGPGTPGPVFAELSRRLLADIRGNPAMRTAI